MNLWVILRPSFPSFYIFFLIISEVIGRRLTKFRKITVQIKISSSANFYKDVEMWRFDEGKPSAENFRKSTPLSFQKYKETHLTPCHISNKKGHLNILLRYKFFWLRLILKLTSNISGYSLPFHPNFLRWLFIDGIKRVTVDCVCNNMFEIKSWKY